MPVLETARAGVSGERRPRMTLRDVALDRPRHQYFRHPISKYGSLECIRRWPAPCDRNAARNTLPLVAGAGPNHGATGFLTEQDKPAAAPATR